MAVKVFGVGGANTRNGSELLFFLLRTKKIKYIRMEDRNEVKYGMILKSMNYALFNYLKIRSISVKIITISSQENNQFEPFTFTDRFFVCYEL
ncbi:hypothetical protein BLL40_15640 [Domibacillus mangrovi]|uniref:Uncharacterized protein n=1 Tax=Domibacillus mangrovi TaxID=1714354 RepID=A0A1Q5NZF1_9BACI|nr:hypothetical protein BLL40_15640 [Domibacillus mangrovi]